MDRSPEERNQLALQFDWLAHAVAKDWQFRARGLDLDDLIQEARIGILIAAEAYEDKFGDKGFIAYARLWATDQIQKATLHRSCRPYVPMYLLQAIRRIRRKAANLNTTDLSSVARQMGFSKKRLELVLEAMAIPTEVQGLSPRSEPFVSLDESGECPKERLEPLLNGLSKKEANQARSLWKIWDKPVDLQSEREATVRYRLLRRLRKVAREHCA